MVQHTFVLQPGDTLTVSCATVGGKRKSRRNNNSMNLDTTMENNNLNENNNNDNNNNNNDNNDNLNKLEDLAETENTNLTDEEMAMNTLSGGKRKTRSGKSRKAARKAGRKTRKQSGGKKGSNGYMKFAAEVRPQILKEHPELKSDVVKVARKIGEKWRALSDSEKAKY